MFWQQKNQKNPGHWKSGVGLLESEGHSSKRHEFDEITVKQRQVIDYVIEERESMKKAWIALLKRSKATKTQGVFFEICFLAYFDHAGVFIAWFQQLLLKLSYLGKYHQRRLCFDS